MAHCSCGCGASLPVGNRCGLLRKCSNRLRQRQFSALVPVVAVTSFEPARPNIPARVTLALECGHAITRVVANRGCIPERSKCAECGRLHRIERTRSRVPITCPDDVWTRVSPEPNTGCWLWTAKVDRHGYGIYGCGRPTARRLAHRLVWTLFRGPIPRGLNACHRCDNPLCVNPDHIFLGTQADNLADMRRKGRGTIFGRRAA